MLLKTIHNSLNRTKLWLYNIKSRTVQMKLTNDYSISNICWWNFLWQLQTFYLFVSPSTLPFVPLHRNTSLPKNSLHSSHRMLVWYARRSFAGLNTHPGQHSYSQRPRRLHTALWCTRHGDLFVFSLSSLFIYATRAITLGPSLGSLPPTPS